MIHLISIVPGRASGNEMAHQLHVLQTLMLNVLEDKMNRPIDPGDADAQEKVRELRRIAFEGSDGGGGGGGLDPGVRDVTPRHPKTSPRDFRKLGFKDDTTPLNDFGKRLCHCNPNVISSEVTVIFIFRLAQTPPGALALDAMLYFARYHPEKYTRVVLENSGRGDDYDCPFARAAIELTKLLCEILKVGVELFVVNLFLEFRY